MRRERAFFFYSLFFFSAALVACKSVRCRVRVLFVLSASIKPRHRYKPGQCLPLAVRVWVVKCSRAGYDAMRFVVGFFVFSDRLLRDRRSNQNALSLSPHTHQPPVIATLGPACRDVETLKEMLEAGMSCARVDLTVRK